MLRPYDGPARVLVGHDGSADSDSALRYAVTAALAHDAELVLLFAVDDMVLNSAWGVVFDPETIRGSALEVLRGAVDRAVEAGMPSERIRHEIELGNPAAVLSRLSETASLIVIGRSSVAEGERAYIGSTAVGVAGTAHCPVIVVSGDQEQRTARTGTIGVGVNTAAKGAVALEWALQECEAQGGRVAVVSVAKAAAGGWFRGGGAPAEVQAEVLAVTRERVEAMIAPLAAQHPGVEVELDVVYGNPLDVLVARSADFDLLVIEVQPAFPTYSIGGTTRGLMAYSHCPVGTIRTRDSHGS
ncbi:MAG: universal stress protein [Actinobacteria bacterium]|nr:universal stress protein [Actinomycetota bacterium]